MDWEALRNIFLQYLEEQLQNWDRDFQSLLREVLNRLKKEGYEITPEIEKQLSDFAVEKIDQINSLIVQTVVITTGLSLKDPLVDDIVREVFNYRYPDGLNLSERLWDWSAELKYKLKETLQVALVKGRSADRIVYELQDAINKHQGKDRAIVLKEKLPEWVKELEDIARATLKDLKTRTEFEKKIKEFEKQVSRLSKEGSYYTSKQLLNQIKKAVKEDKEYLIDKAIEYHIYHRQLSRLKTIARTEAANAYNKAQIKMTEEDKDLIGYRWKLSKSHPAPDICDYLASVNYGYGKGIHPKNKVPRQKAHPNCMCYLIPVYDWEVKGKEKETPTVSKEVLERFAPKYIREFTEAGYDIKDLFSEKEKRFLKKEEAMRKFGEDEFSLVQKRIERRFLQNLKKLENAKSKDELLEKFPELWKRKRRFEEHIGKRKKLGHISEENAELEYAKRIIQVLSEFDKVFVEKRKSGSQIDYFHKDDWVVIINERGKIETAYKLETTLSKFTERHKIKNELAEGEINEEFRETIKSIWDRVRLF